MSEYNLRKYYIINKKKKMKEFELINVCNSIDYDKMLNYVETAFNGNNFKNSLSKGNILDDINDAVAQYIYDSFGVDLWTTEVYDENDEIIFDVAYDWFLDYYQLYSNKFCKWISLKIVEKIWTNESLDIFQERLFEFLTLFPIQKFKI